jgi:hypothetical protein
MDKLMSRREFFKIAGRAAAAGGLALLAGRLLGFGWRDAREICVNEGVCRGCAAVIGCRLPAALSFREKAPRAG